MSDFDFDELDKAVTTVIGGGAKPEPVASSPIARPAVAINDITPPVAEPVKPLVTPTPAPRPQTPESAPAARRSNGRFMDMVRNPAYAARTTAPATPISRTAPTVDRPTPTSEELKAKIAALTRRDETPAAVQAAPVIEDPRQPLESPFLADAKVEKRPLGMQAPTGFDASQLLEEPDDPRLEAPDPVEVAALDETYVDPIDFAAPQPVDQPQTDTPEEPQIEDELTTVAPQSKVPIQSAPVVNLVQEATPEPVANSPTSIQPQYEAHPTTEGESGAIYDTEAYHQPLPTAAKKKSGAWVILWIVLLLVLGGAVGAAVYFYALPLL